MNLKKARRVLTAKELFHAGNLEEAVALLTGELREAPMDAGRRTFLVELLCITGQWDRAARVLDGMQDSRGTNKALYGRLLHAESRRRAFLRGEAKPRLLVAAGAGIDLRPYEEMARAVERGETSRVSELVDEISQMRPLIAGRRVETNFADLRDADDRFAPFLEVLEGEDYAWLPLRAIRSLSIKSPQHPFDFVFAPAVVDLGAGPRRMFTPARYPGSERAQADALRMGQQTTTLEGEAVCCLGQRVFLIDSEPVPLFELNSLEIDRLDGVEEGQIHGA